MENMKKEQAVEELRQKFKQEFMNRLSNKPTDQPDVQVILNELMQKTELIDEGAIPPNLERIDQMKFTYVMAKKYTSGLNVTVRLYENAPFAGMGSVQIEGRLVEFANTEFFARMAEFSDNTDIYTLSNGMTRIVFTFHGIAQKNC